jgi:hypothetical protein
MSEPSLPTPTYSHFLAQVRTGSVAKVTVIGGNSGVTPAICRLKSGGTVRAVLPSDCRDALAPIEDHLVNIEIRDTSSGCLRLLLNVTAFLLLAGVWLLFLIRRSPVGPGAMHG